MKYTFHGYVENERLNLYNRNGLKNVISEFEGKQVSISIQHRKTERTNNQNRYYWGVVIPLIRQGLKDAGYRGVTKESTHKLLKSLFLKGEIVNENTGEVLNFEGSTASLSTVEFNEFIEEAAQWAAENIGIEIPEPNTQMEIEI